MNFSFSFDRNIIVKLILKSILKLWMWSYFKMLKRKHVSFGHFKGVGLLPSQNEFQISRVKRSRPGRNRIETATFYFSFSLSQISLPFSQNPHSVPLAFFWCPKVSLQQLWGGDSNLCPLDRGQMSITVELCSLTVSKNSYITNV